MCLEQLTPAQVMQLEILTGGICVFRFDAQLRILEIQNL